MEKLIESKEIIKYKKLLNNYYHHGYSENWLKGYIQCLYTLNEIDLREAMYLQTLVEQCKP